MRKGNKNTLGHLYLVSIAAVVLFSGCSDDGAGVGVNLVCEPGLSICGQGCCAHTCCDGVCIDTVTNAANCGQCGNACDPGKVCSQSHCVLEEDQCGGKQRWCEGGCVNTASDRNHCGDCTTRCKPGEVCSEGVCTTECAPGYKVVDGACRNILVDSAYCGDPAVACADNMYCGDGVCKCLKGYTDCDGNPDNGCEPVASCQAVETCASPRLECDGECVDPRTDSRYCGDCDTSCEEGEICVGGDCKPTGSPEKPCESDLTLCYGQCVDLRTDGDNCGTCLNVCGENESCVAGKCTPDCKGLRLCGSVCIDTMNHAGHCGDCDKACLSGQACVGGDCQCAEGRYDCDGDSSNGCESETKCECTPGETRPCWRGDKDAKFKSTEYPNTICEKGSQICDESGQFWGACTGGVYPAALTCDLMGNLNGLDNDCNGEIDTVCRSECDLKAGDMSYIGCEYWSVYLYNLIADETSNQTVVFSNPSDTDTATIYIYDKAGFENSTQKPKHTVTLAPKAVERVEINKKASNMCVSTGIMNNAYRIRSTQPITAYQFNPWDNPSAHSNDASLLLPANVLGRDYIVMTWHSESGGDHTSYFTVVATEPGTTTVKVKTTSNIVKKASGTVDIAAMTKGEERTFTLERFGVLTLNAPAAAADNKITDDQTGTTVHADKKIAVFGGSRSSYIPNHNAKNRNGTTMTCCRDHIEEQLLPTQAWGKSYYAVQAYTTGVSGDFWRIVARDNNTKVTIKGSEKNDGTITLNAGEAYPSDITDYFESKGGFVVTADKPIVLGQFLPSQGYHVLNIGDPSFILTVPYEQYRSDYAFMVPDKFDVNYITVVMPKDAQIKLDGNVVTKYVKTGEIQGTDFMYGYLQMQGGVHRMESDKPFGLYGYGYFNMSSYGYPIGMDLKILNTN